MKRLQVHDEYRAYHVAVHSPLKHGLAYGAWLRQVRGDDSLKPKLVLRERRKVIHHREQLASGIRAN
jgi:hypothetical protein